MNDFYTSRDSAEVREVLYSKLQEDERQPIICTDAEYDKFAEAGCDMSEYMTIRQLEQIVRANELKQMKERLLSKQAV